MIRFFIKHVLIFLVLEGYSQEQKINYIEGNMLHNLKSANTDVYYRYEIDSLRSTYVMFDKRGKVKKYFFDCLEMDAGALFVDTTYGSRGSYTIALKDGNGNKLFNSISKDFYGVLVIGGYHGLDRLGRQYSYYPNKRLSTISYYDVFGDETAEEVVFYKRKGNKFMERSLNKETGQIEMVFFKKNGSIDFQLNEGENISIRFQYDKNGILIVKDSIYDVTLDNGVSISYFKDGSIRQYRPFSNGLRNGVTRTFFEKNKIKSEINYVDGLVVGQYNYYNRDGEIILSGIIEEGEKLPKKFRKMNR